jgi:hypothetical protein
MIDLGGGHHLDLVALAAYLVIMTPVAILLLVVKDKLGKVGCHR